ncbi:phosphodiester glycosidase family protein [Vibrio sp. 404]|uniref:Phosphodiester glycosidase family protein n=1 Tax=Vibrio marinisediminis TaxID=2758441 RepID=A0A7W2ISA0_9VIBR|nr:phosphodiester glycosidase family protein [Vibrio marinisediminis]MBA5760912.1 phosphodiester glycosidase family protein [Vibrio marinisediminis]
MNKTLLAMLISSLPFLAHASQWDIPDLGVGDSALTQSVEHQKLAEGVDFYQVVRGESHNETYLLSSGVLNEKTVAQYVATLKKLDIQHTVEVAPEPAPNGRPLGEIVRIRGFSSAEQAGDFATQLKQSDLSFSTRFSAQDGYPTRGPFDISLLRIDLNQYQGKVESILANDKITTAETVSSMAKRNNALAAVNGGFFAFSDKVGDLGAPAGLYVQDGELLREAANQRPVLIIDNSGNHSKVMIGASVETQVLLSHNNQELRIDGLNRKPGIILNCGGFGDTPSTEAIHDFVCTDDSEIIVYNSAYGSQTPKGEGSEIILDAAGKVVAINPSRGSQITSEHQYIQLSGEATLSVKLGDTVTIESKVLVDGKEVALTKGLSMLNAGPSLVTNFEIDKASRNTQGFNPYPSTGNHAGSQDDDGLGVSGAMENREGFYNGWVLRRHPRTALGVTAENVLYAAVVYGRAPTVTEGASITDMAVMMKSLGTKSAINLDGGGSSMMVVDGKRTGSSSDASEREVSDAIVFTH